MTFWDEKCFRYDSKKEKLPIELLLVVHFDFESKISTRLESHAVSMISLFDHCF